VLRTIENRKAPRLLRGKEVQLKEIRLHGRGGQGVVTASEIVGLAAFADGKYALAFPSFGSERMGAPVQSFVKISDEPIRPGTRSRNLTI